MDENERPEMEPPGTERPETERLETERPETERPETETGGALAQSAEAAPAAPAVGEPSRPDTSALTGAWVPRQPQSGWNPYGAAEVPTPPPAPPAPPWSSGLPTPPAGTAAWESTVPMPPAGVPAWESTVPTPPAGTPAWQSWQSTTPTPPVPPPPPGWGWPEQQPPSWVPMQPPAGGQPPAGAPFPQAGWPQVAAGSSGIGQPPTGEGDAPESGEPGNPHGLRRIVLVGLGAVLLLGAVAGGVYIGRSSNRTPSQTTASETIPSPSKSSNPGTNAKINVAAIAAKVDPAVVDITSILGASGTGDEAAGTGMILTPNGEVLTNNHVIADGTSITAQIDGAGKTYQVLVLGTDPTQDVALVQLVGASGLPTVTIGNSAQLQVGDPVVAIGNALDLKGPETVTQGIVSALDRSISASDAGTGATENLNGLIQTDAPINPGNSGGPLVNASGQVIGMDTAAASGSSTQSATDVGFAIPVNQAVAVAQQIQQGKASSTVIINNKGFIGVQVISISEAESQDNGFYGQFPTPGTNSGAYVAGVLQGTPAVQAGLQVGDVITAVNGSTVSSPQALGTVLSNDKPGQAVSVTWVEPSGAHHTASITLVARPVA